MGAGEIAQWLRVTTALTGGLSFIPNTTPDESQSPGYRFFFKKKSFFKNQDLIRKHNCLNIKDTRKQKPNLHYIIYSC